MTWSRAMVSTQHGRPVFSTPNDRRQRMGEFALFWKAASHPRVEKGIGLAMRVEFVFERPGGHFGSGRNAGVLKDAARDLRPGRGKFGGDLDNLVKLVKDGLNDVAYRDDSQIAELHAVKRFQDVTPEGREEPHTTITLVPLDSGQELPEYEPAPAQPQLDLVA